MSPVEDGPEGTAGAAGAAGGDAADGPDASPASTDREPLPPKARALVAPLAERGLDAELCDACLGRFVARLGYGLTNAERGRQLRRSDGQPGELAAGPAPDVCGLCRGLSRDAPDRMADIALAAADGIEHATFALGSRVDEAIEAREEALLEATGLAETAEPLRTELTREAGKRYEAATGSTFDPRRPDLMLIVDTRYWAVETEIAPRYVRGRYLKHVRDLPQTRWHCRSCRGVGCVECDMTGRLYEDSVEELIGRPAMEAFLCEDAVLHGQGREDIDARMLGTGRPFVLELKRPLRRSADLAALAEAVAATSEGRVEVRDLAWAEGDEVAAVKEARTAKTYRAEVRFADPVEGENLKKATSALEGATIRQRTPSRVAHRRADRTRTRRVLRCHVEAFDPDRPRQTVLRVAGDAGLYIKELVSSDDGRTEPSLAGLLGVEAEVTALDVVAVGDGNGDGRTDGGEG